MSSFGALPPIDYLIVGHLTADKTPQGLKLGGTAAYSALTARALGMRVGIVTAWAGEISLEMLDGIAIVNTPTESSTIFENISTPTGRKQYIHSVAADLHLGRIPDAWHSTPIVHLGPVAQEVDPALVRHFPNALLGVTPQGWLRAWDSTGRIYPAEWPESSFVLGRAGATVLSIEDLGHDESRLDEIVVASRVLAITESGSGARLYWHGDVRRFRTPEVDLVDDTGAGDIFAAAFFVRLYTTRDPWEAARFANTLAAYSVSRLGLNSIPQPDEIEACSMEVI